MKTYTGSNQEVTIEYTVTSKHTDDFITTSFSKVVDFLLDDDTLYSVASVDFNKEQQGIDGAFQEDDFRDFMFSNYKAYAQEFGYTILTNLK